MIIVSRILDVRALMPGREEDEREGEERRREEETTGDSGNPIEFASVAISNGLLDYVYADSSTYIQLLSQLVTRGVFRHMNRVLAAAAGVSCAAAAA